MPFRRRFLRCRHHCRRRCAERRDLGRISPGAKADIAVFDMADSMIAHGSTRSRPLSTALPVVHPRNHRRWPDFDARRRGCGYRSFAAREQAQRQFDGLVAKYPERTFRHPPVEDIFPAELSAPASYPARSRDDHPQPDIAAIPALEVKGLSVEFPTRKGILTACPMFRSHVERGEILGVVGESGAGKSMTGMAVLGLLEPPAGLRRAKFVSAERVPTLSASLR